MRSIIALGSLLLLPATTAVALTPVYIYSQRYGGTGGDIGRAIATDASGNVIIAGTFIGTADFGGVPLVSAGGADIFIAKYASNGTHQWSKRFGDVSTDFGFSVAFDASGNVILSGSFSGSVDFGGGLLASAGLEDIFVVKLDAAGTHLWSQRHGSTTADQANAIAVDGAGNVVVAGRFQGTVDFGGGPLVSAGGNDVFVTKRDPNGTHLWSNRYGAVLGQAANDVAVDPTNNDVIVAGFFESSVDFGGGVIASAGFVDAFVARYNSSGAHVWSDGFGGTGSETATGVAVDGAGNVHITGSFSSTADFGGTPLVSAGSSDSYAAKYNASGAHLWSRGFGGVGIDGGNSIDVDDADNTVITGTFNNTVNFGGGPLVSQGLSDIFLAKYGPAGDHEWSQRFGSTGSDNGNALDVGVFQNAFMTGGFSATVDFGGGPLVSAGQFDVFVARYSPHALIPQIDAIADVPNDQGRRVTVEFLGSGLDNPAFPPSIVQYEAFFRNDPLSLAAASALAAAGEARPRISSPATTSSDWVYVGAVPAHGDPSYALFAPTTADSTVANGQHQSVFFVRAATDNPFVYYDSPIDSGYSVDNLAPSAPSGFVFNSGLLTWDESGAADFDYFSVYGSTASIFDGSAVFIGYTTGTAMNVSASPHAFYYLTATDFSGNEGGAARINTLTGVDAPSSYALGINAYPNPFNPTTTIRYNVPSSGRVVLSIYDVNGRLVATLLDENREAGEHIARWNGRDARGRASSSGIYFARLEWNGATQTRKLVLLK